MTRHYIIMGVSGCGKSTIGKLLAEALGVHFIDGDDFHPEANINKMSKGIALTDVDREPWLNALVNHMQSSDKAIVLACSALKQKYREILRNAGDIHFIYLDGSKELLQQRLDVRSAESDHFMSSNLLDSQLSTLEKPLTEQNVITISIDQSPEQALQTILTNISTI